MPGGLRICQRAVSKSPQNPAGCTRDGSAALRSTARRLVCRPALQKTPVMEAMGFPVRGFGGILGWGSGGGRGGAGAAMSKAGEPPVAGRRLLRPPPPPTHPACGRPHLLPCLAFWADSRLAFSGSQCRRRSCNVHCRRGGRTCSPVQPARWCRAGSCTSVPCRRSECNPRCRRRRCTAASRRR